MKKKPRTKLHWPERYLGLYLIGLIWLGEKISALFIKIQDGGNADSCCTKSEEGHDRWFLKFFVHWFVYFSLKVPVRSWSQVFPTSIFEIWCHPYFYRQLTKTYLPKCTECISTLFSRNSGLTSFLFLGSWKKSFLNQCLELILEVLIHQDM